jgi:hypothetical protein
MSFARFSNLSDCICCGLLPGEEEELEDRFWKVRGLFDAFNLQKNETLVAGAKLELDETMFALKGRDGRFDILGNPAKVKIKGKPESTGLEIFSVADVSSGVFLKLELNEGRLGNSKKKYVAEEKSLQVALVKRLTEPWSGTGRTVYADSHFGSVASAVAMSEFGLFFSAVIKTAHANSAKTLIMEDLEGAAKGTSVFYLGTLPNSDRKLIMVGHQDIKPKVLISNFGSTASGADHHRKYHLFPPSGKDMVVDISIPRPLIVSGHFSSIGSIDLGNRRRQGYLRLEKTNVTKRFER